MAVKLYKPLTPARRGMTGTDYSELTEKKPLKSLTKRVQRAVGRSRGKITVRHKGGGHKRRFRTIDFKYKLSMPAKVEEIAYDPNRSAFLARLLYPDGERRYVLANEGLHTGEEVIADEKTPLKPGNRMQLGNIPVGTQIFNVELNPGRGGQLLRAAGSSGTVMAAEGPFVHVKLSSSEVRRIRARGMATIGQASNVDHENISVGKAGKSRWLGIRPSTRGKAMNPVDHPHGGGEGGSPIGLKHPKTPWGKPALGARTRKKNKASNKYIVRRRKSKRR